MIKCCSPAKAPKIAVEFNNVNVGNSDYFTTLTFNNVVRSLVGNFFIIHENIRSFGNFFDEFHSFESELNRAADVIVFSETWFSANTCHCVQGYTFIHIVLSKQEAVPLCSLEIVIHQPIWPNFQCVMHITR